MVFSSVFSNRFPIPQDRINREEYVENRLFVSGIDQIAWEIFVVRILVNNFGSVRICERDFSQ